MEPILIDVPERIETERLVLRVPRAGDGPLVNDAIGASHAELAPWMPWAGTMPSVDESEAHCRRHCQRGAQPDVLAEPAAEQRPGTGRDQDQPAHRARHPTE